MSKDVMIGNQVVGENGACFVIAEIGINHNGDMAIAKQLMKLKLKWTKLILR